MTLKRGNFAFHKKRATAPRPQVRSLKEFAEEFGINLHALARFVKVYDGPKPTLLSATARSQATYYEINAMRTWWRELQDARGTTVSKED